MTTQPITRLAFLAPVALLAACAGSESAEVRSVGTYEDARITGASSATLSGQADLSPDELRLVCDQDPRDVEAEVIDGELVVDVQPVNARCEIGVYGPDLHRLHLQMAADQDGPDHIELNFNADADVTLTELDAPDVDIAVGGGATVAVDRIYGGAVDFDMTGGGSLSLGTVEAVGLAIHTRGTSYVDIESLSAQSWTIDAAGTTDLWAEGGVEDAWIEAQGTSVIDAMGVTAMQAEIIAGGSAQVGLTVEEEVTVDASGDSSVEIGGDPAVANVEADSSAEVIGL